MSVFYPELAYKSKSEIPHPLKAPLPIVSKDELKCISFNKEQSTNAFVPISLNDSGNDTSTSDVQDLKASSPIDSTLGLKTTEDKL